jgi:hypothetical protein
MYFLFFRKKESTKEKTPGYALFYESLWFGFACATRTLLMPDFEVMNGSVVLSFPRQQKSFGRNQAKRWWP